MLLLLATLVLLMHLLNGVSVKSQWCIFTRVSNFMHHNGQHRCDFEFDSGFGDDGDGKVSVY